MAREVHPLTAAVAALYSPEAMAEMERLSAKEPPADDPELRAMFPKSYDAMMESRRGASPASPSPTTDGTADDEEAQLVVDVVREHAGGELGLDAAKGMDPGWRKLVAKLGRMAGGRNNR